MNDFDELLTEVGDFGRYQVAIFFLLCLPAGFPSAWTAFNQVFVAAVPPHWCADDAVNSSAVAADQCSWLNSTAGHSLVVPCTSWRYDTSTYSSTIVTEFDLVCAKQHWADISTMLFYIGSFIGNILFGYVADRWGRRFSFFVILATQVIFGTANAFAMNIFVFVILRFVVGLTFPALYQIPFIISMEMMGPSSRIFAGMLICVFFGSAMCALGVVASFVRHWSVLILVCNAPFAVLFVYWFFLPESPRWLISSRRFTQAAAILCRIGKCNGRLVDSKRIMESCAELHMRSLSDSDVPHRHNLFDLFATPNLRKKTLIVTYIWLVNAVVYNGLTLNVPNLPVNDYLSFAILGGVEVPAYFIVWPMLNRCGRRWPLCGAMLLSGAACLCVAVVPAHNAWLISALAFTGKFGIAASFAIVYIFAGELYPTVVRAVGMGMSSMVAGSGLILGPYLVGLVHLWRILPMLIMGLLAVTAGIAGTFLPETLGSHLPQTIVEAEEFGKGQTLWRRTARQPADVAQPAETVHLFERHSMLLRKSDENCSS